MLYDEYIYIYMYIYIYIYIYMYIYIYIYIYIMVVSEALGFMHSAFVGLSEDLKETFILLEKLGLFVRMCT